MSNYINRELSWLRFNERVLAQAEDMSVPLLERLKFISIYASNLDEFYMVRVAGLRKMMQEEIVSVDTPDDLSPREVLQEVRRSVDASTKRCFKNLEGIMAEMATYGIVVSQMAELSREDQKFCQEYFHDQVAPVLTPLAVDPAHPFPYLSNLRPYLVAAFDIPDKVSSGASPVFGLLEVPSILPRFVALPERDAQKRFVILEDLITAYLSAVFVGFPIQDVFHVRCTRNLDYNLLENEVVDLLKSVQKEVSRRWAQEIVRMEVSANLPHRILQVLLESQEVEPEDVYVTDGPFDLSRFAQLSRIEINELHDPPFNPRLPARLAKSSDIFGVISDRDLMVHLPFDSFYAVTQFLYAAAYDPDVLAIKQTLYRTSGDSPIIEALMIAAENGKQVIAVIELKARFDEKANIVWARQLERSGVNVVYGFVGHKTHAKAALVVRREKGKLVRYAHLSTGNYNSNTARFYTDMGIFTRNEKITEDVANVFNFLTGYNILAGEKRLNAHRLNLEFNAIAIAPFELRKTFLAKIDREIVHAKSGKKGRLIAKMNALIDKSIIDKLYEASSAGVQIDLVVRGMCCLRPGIKGLSSNIRVRSVIDRFLEHTRIYYFENGGEQEVLLSSADWMPRNFDRRIEVAFPLLDKGIKEYTINHIVLAYLADNQSSWELASDGSYSRVKPEGKAEPFRVQAKLIEHAREEGIKSVPYETAIRIKKKGKAPIAKRKPAKKK